jgi:sirohydrochlorin ferrochelatase
LAQGVVLLAHGSRVAEANEAVRQLALKVASLLPGTEVEVAYLVRCRPTLPESVGFLRSRGVREIVVVPLFLLAGHHMREDIPRLVAAVAEQYPDLELTCSANLGLDGRIAEMVAERVREEVGKRWPSCASPMP